MKFLRTARSGRARALVGVTAAALILTACGGADDGGDTEGEDTETEDTEGEDAESGGAVGEGQSVTIGWMPWEEAIAVTNLWEVILSANGYEVDQQQLDAGLVYEGMSAGDVDLFLDAWLPNTHSDYMDQYEDDLEDLGVWLEEAPLTWTVPSYVEDVSSIADLQGNADMFDGQIIGIEPGAGLTRISQDEVIPTYELGDSYDLVTSSTPGMLAELDSAIQNEEPIVVTLWRPHPAYAQYDLKDLEDPEGALGEADSIHALGTSGFSEDHPELASALENFQFEHDALSELEVAVLEDVEEGNELEGAETWANENTDLINEWLDGTELTYEGSEG